MTPERIRRAAELLRDDAECLKASHTIPRTGRWLDDLDSRRAWEEHNERLALALDLETLVGKVMSPSGIHNG